MEAKLGDRLKLPCNKRVNPLASSVEATVVGICSRLATKAKFVIVEVGGVEQEVSEFVMEKFASSVTRR